jgi:hypothetical protein
MCKDSLCIIRGNFFLTILSLLLIFSTKHYTPSPEQHSATRKSGAQVVDTWIEEWDPKKLCWIRVEGPEGKCSSVVNHFPRDAAAAPLARFGPFVVLDDRVAAIFGATNSESLEQFSRMMAAFPNIEQLNFVDASGTTNDTINLKIGRLIRASGISTHVPSYGSARSGAVDLFIAGTRRSMEPGARFAVHCWIDPKGREPHDFPIHDPCNTLYLDYYMEMGMSHDKAHQFYDMTNSVPHASALWFGAEQMQFWLDASSSIDREEERRQHRAEGEGH